MEKGNIYKIINKINEKIYIGCTIYSLKKRFEEHCFRCLKTNINTKLCNSIRKYGIENFNIELIKTCDLSKIYDEEKKVISEYNSFSDGLNCTLGGEGCLGYKHSAEVRKKISDIIKNGKSHKNKTYEDIYGEQFEKEKNKRKISVKKNWDDLDSEKRKERVKKTIDTIRSKSKYGVELVEEIRKKINEGYKITELQKMYPQVYKNFFYDLKNGKRWKIN